MLIICIALMLQKQRHSNKKLPSITNLYKDDNELVQIYFNKGLITLRLWLKNLNAIKP
ncbi:hypothetical protein amad1_14195 [Alteromonas mediterranea DE1]|nr:hypothetical protein amad1_14195 [Alteromonas mediterranea DE1]AGP98347.1 hypothetical protein I635_14170 [Alteromonas mediterranea UM7]AGQ02602.1 hypothetical protein I636_13800 [Alteromonas mediterranea UM4b]